MCLASVVFLFEFSIKPFILCKLSLTRLVTNEIFIPLYHLQYRFIAVRRWGWGFWCAVFCLGLSCLLTSDRIGPRPRRCLAVIRDEVNCDLFLLDRCFEVDYLSCREINVLPSYRPQTSFLNWLLTALSPQILQLWTSTAADARTAHQAICKNNCAIIQLPTYKMFTFVFK